MHGTVLDAALELGVTSSAVSQQIGKLEREVGVPLLERAGRGVILTDAAHVLVRAAEEYTAATERATARIEDLREEAGGTLRVACFPSAIGPILAPVLAQMRRAAPGLQIRLQEMFPDRAEDAVIGGHVDIAITHLWGEAVPATGHGLASEPLLDDIVDVYLPVTHPLAGEESVSLTQLVDDSWVADDLEGFTRKWLVRRMTEVGRRPRVDHQVDEISAQLALVGAGLCNLLLPRLAAQNVPDGVVRVALTGPPTFRRLHALYRETVLGRPAARRFLEAVRHMTT